MDSKNDNDKANVPSFPSPEPTVSYFDDLDYLKDFENEFPAIVYNDALTSKSDFLSEPTVLRMISEAELKALEDLKSILYGLRSEIFGIEHCVELKYKVKFGAAGMTLTKNGFPEFYKELEAEFLGAGAKLMGIQLLQLELRLGKTLSRSFRPVKSAKILC
ncbi:hypothetical protein Tco_0629233 [Tanacetum coccineum]|uniref:Uncharacterized protein n=1 Tax=Tanacetum coccineum TaxID=301880 RepID=A0ABQ4WSK5_9ASTR